MQKVCNVCKIEKPLADFAKDKAKKDGARGKCRACQRDYLREWRMRPGVADKARARTKASNAKHSAARSAYGRLRFYGMSLDDVQNLFAAQNGCCAICSVPINISGPGHGCIDHDHSSGAIRGFLCRKCNAGLGMFRDNTEHLASAIAYLSGARHVLAG